MTSAALRSPTGVAAEIVALLPKLKKFALTMTRGNEIDAEDLVQETVLLALENIDSYERGSALQGWLWVIMRNRQVTAWRKVRREVSDPDQEHALAVKVAPAQEGHIVLRETGDAVDRLPAHYRSALLLVGAADMSYEDAGDTEGCPAGTMKSRLNRARALLVIMDAEAMAM